MLNKTLKFEDIITFTRSSAATYWGANGVLQTAAIDEPRFDHDRVTGEPLGILCEGQATNLIKNSEDLNSDWQILSGAVITKEADEDGCTVHKIDFNGDNGAIVRSLGDITDGIFHYEIRSDAPTTIRNRGTKDGSGIAVPVVNVTTEWTAHEFSYPGSTYADPGFQCNAAGDSSPIYVRLIQAEMGNSPSSYIPTNGAAATRSGDFADVESLSSWFNTQPEMTLLADWIRTPHGVNSSTVMHALRKNAGITAGYFGFYSTMNGLVYTGSEAAQAILFAKGPLSFCKTGISISGDTLIIGVNDDIRDYDGSTYSNVVNQEKLQLTAGRYAGWLQNVRYYPYSISEEEMAEELS